MRVGLVASMVAGLFFVVPTSAGGEVLNCGGEQAIGTLTCSVTGPAMIVSDYFVGDGGSSAQYQWVGATAAAAPGILTLEYTYTGMETTLFGKIGMRLTVNQPTCAEEPHQSRRNWVNTLTDNSVSQQINLQVLCAGTVDYIITSRAASYTLGGSFVGYLAPPALTFTPAGP